MVARNGRATRKRRLRGGKYSAARTTSVSACRLSASSPSIA